MTGPGTVVDVDAVDPASVAGAVALAAEALWAGRLVVVPTETVYGIASRPDDAAATERLFTAKRRPPDLNLPVLAAVADEALALGQASDVARALADELWPGPLTVVMRRSERSRGWRLGGDRATIGVRVPDHPMTLALLRETGPLAVTSANRSGEPPAVDRDALVAAFGSAVDVYVVSGAAPSGGRSSTVVDLTGPRARRLRPGPVDGRVLQILRRIAPDGEPIDFDE